MKTLGTRWRLIALVPLVAVAILSLGSRTGAVPDQNREVREAANEVGFVVQGGITQGQVFRFNAVHQVGPGGGPHIVLELRVFDSQGNVVASHLFQFPDPGQNQGNNTWRSQSFDLDADLLSSNTYDSAGRAQLTGVFRHLPSSQSGGIPGGGCLVSGEIFNNGDVNGRRTLVHIAGIPIS
ncbi:MAG: hypothetical protein ABJC10_01145 [Acidobacteriota bacterium]